MEWSSSAKPGLRRAVAGLAGSADQTRIEGGLKSAPPRQRRPQILEILAQAKPARTLVKIMRRGAALS